MGIFNQLMPTFVADLLKHAADMNDCEFESEEVTPNVSEVTLSGDDENVESALFDVREFFAKGEPYTGEK